MCKLWTWCMFIWNQFLSQTLSIIHFTETRGASFGDQTGGGDFKDDQTASLKGQSVVSEAESRDTTACPVNHSVVTDAEREDDKRSRIQVLLRLIQLACMMVHMLV